MKYLAFTVGNYVVKPPGGLPTGGLTTTQHIIAVAIEIFLIIVAILSLVSIIWAGLRWMMSKGEKGVIEQSKLQLIYAVGGLVVAFCGFLIVQLIGNFFSINLF